MRLINEYGLDGIFIVNLQHPFIDSNFLYFLKPKSGIFENSALFITENERILFTTELEAPAAKEIDVRIEIINKFDDIYKFLKRFSRIGINKKFLPANLFERLKSLGLQLVDVSEELEELRESKTDEEIEFIKEAIRISEKALEKVVSLDMEKMKEVELAAELEYYMKKYGSQGLSFDTIVAYDENSAIPHYKTGSNDKYPKRVVLIDFGAKYRNYCSDITRTFILKRDDEIIDVYNTVLEAQTRAIEEIREGKTAEEIDRIARDIIEKNYAKRFIHSLGHMFGIEIHEGKRLRPGEKWKLKEGMVFTVEPGIYLEGKFGVRIEDDILVKKEGAEILTSFPKDLDKVMI